MKKYVLILVLTINAFAYTNGQNRYLSFIEGEKEQITTPKRTVNNINNKSVELSFSFSGAYVSEKNEKDTNYCFFHIDGLPMMTQLGAPALPARNEIIAIPKGAEGEIVIIETKYYEYNGYYAHPAIKPATDREGDPEPIFEKDHSIYNKNEYFPQKVVEITDIGLSRGTRLARVQIRPVQFNPVTKKVRVYTSVKFKIEFVGGVGNYDYISRENSIHYSNLLKQTVLNSEIIPDGISLNRLNNFEESSVEKNYIIITHSEYLNYANQLANEKRQLGYSVEVVSQSSWTSAEVKTAISTRYAAWTPKPDYFVIIGDHTGSYAVPAEIKYTSDSPPEPFTTDLYYACMDGASDFHPDMAHGRISVSNATEAQVVIDKIVNYELNPVNNSTFYSNVLNCAQYQDDNNNGYADRRFCHTSEDIRNYLISKGYTSTRVYSTSTTFDKTLLRYNNTSYSNGQLLPSDLRAATFNWSGGSTDITNAINAGKFIVTHRDHGYVGGSGWATPYYTTSSMNSLSNTNLLPVVFSINCHTGEFQLNNCFAEKFLRMSNKGAVGVFAAAYYSYSGFNDALVEGMFDALFPNPGLYPALGSGGTGNNYHIGTGNEIRTMGDLVNQGLHAMEQNWNGSSSSNEYQYQLFHYFGDPAMKIWTSNPHTTVITATHSDSITCNSTSLSITGSTPGAVATLVHDNNLIGKVVLNGSGAGTITYNISSTVTSATLTISKQDCKPYITNISITGSCTCTPPTTQATLFTSSALTDNSMAIGWTRGNGDSVLVIARANSAVSADPLDGSIIYTASSVFESGTQIGTGNYVVYKGVGTSINITALTSGTTYYYAIYEYKDSSAYCYTKPALTGNATTTGTLPCASYCTSNGNMDYGTSVTLVNLNTINNATAKPAAYNDYTTLSTTVSKDSTYNLTVNLNTDGDYIMHAFAWIDWNHDCDFGDTGEVYDLGTAINVTNGPTTLSPLSIIIPSTALTGNTRMRVSAEYNTDPTSCGINFDGEVEDYTINVASTVCNPPSIQATVFTSSAITNTTMTIGWTRGNGDSVLVVARAGSAVNDIPVGGTSYTANNAFGSGTEIGTGNYVVYSGTGTSTNITNLTSGTTYHYAVYEYNDTSYCYNTPALTGNTMTTCTPVTITTQPTASQTVCTPSSSTSLAVAATGTTPIVYQWQYNNGSTWENVTNGTPTGATYTNETADTMSVNGITSAATHQYRCYVSNCSGIYTDSSNTASLVVNATPTVNTITPQTICSGETTTLVTPISTPTGATYTWTANATTGISGYTTSGTGTIPAQTIATTVTTAGTVTYTITPTLASCTGNTNTFVVNVNPKPTVTNQTAIITSGTAFTVTPTGVPTATTYTWTAPTYTNGVTGGSAQSVGQTNISQTLTAPTSTGTATYTVTPTSGTCIGNTFTVTVTVNFVCIPVAITTQPTATQTACAPSNSVSFTVVATGTSPITYQWQYNNGSAWTNATNGTPAGAIYTNETTASMSVNGITDVATHQYRCYLTNCSGVSTATSNTASLIVNTTPSAAGTITGATTVCQEENGINYTIPLIANATSYIWTLPNGATGTSTTNTINVNYGTTATSGNVTVQGTNTCGNGTIATLAITVNTIPVTPIITQTSNTLTSNATAGNQWYNLATGIINGANSQSYNPVQIGNYFVIVILNGCSSDSSNIIYYTTGIAENNANPFNVKVFPNPFTDKTTIEYTLTENENVELTLVDITGQELIKLKNEKQSKGTQVVILNASKLNNGIYFYKLKIGDKEQKGKLIHY